MADSSLGVAVLRTRLDSSGLRTGLNQAKSETTRATGDMTGAIRGIGAAFGAVAASAGVRSYITFLSSSANLAHQADAAHRLYEKSLQRTNQSTSEGARLVDRLSQRFGVANSVVEESATLMLRQGASLDDVERALTAAGASAAAAGFDISTAFNNVSTAVATGRSELLETSGIVANLGPVAQQYAKSVGKTVEELTQQELIQARVNAIYRETASEIDDVDEILQGLPLAQARVTQGWRDFREDVGGIAQEVIVPLTEGFGTLLGYVNDLPEPVKRAGIAMAGAAIGATALATGIVAIRAALQGLSAAGLLSFGPAGWIVLGVTAVAGLVAVLTGRPDSLDRAIEKANQALAGGDSGTLTGALDEVITQVDGPVKRVFQELRGEIVETGDVGVAQAQRIANALSLIDELRKAQERVAAAQESLAVTSAGARTMREGGITRDATGNVIFDVENELTAIRNQLFALGEAAVAPFIRFDQELGRFVNDAPAEVLEGVLDPEGVQAVLDRASRAVAGAMTGTSGMVNEARIELEAAEAALDAVLARINAPPSSTGAGGDTGPGGGTVKAKTDPIQNRLDALDSELAALERELERGYIDEAEFAEKRVAAIESTISALLRLGANDDIIDRLEGEAGFGPLFLKFREHFANELERELLRFQTGLASEVTASSVRTPTLNERVRAAARVRFTAIDREILAELADSDQVRAAWRAFRLGVTTQALRELEDAGTIGRSQVGPTPVRLLTPAFQVTENFGPVFRDGSRRDRTFELETERFLNFANQIDLVTTNSDRAAEAEARLARERERLAEIGEELARTEELNWRDITAAVRFGGSAAVMYTEQLQLQARAIELAAEKGITLTQALQQLNAERDLETQKVLRATDLMRSRESGGVFSRDNPNFLRDSGQGARDRAQDAADRFAETVVDAGFRMGDAAIQAIKDGDIGGLIQAGLSGAGSILGGANLGSIPFLGGNIGIGSLIAGGIGLLGTLFGALLGGNQSREAQRAAGAAVRSAPAVELNLIINQSLNVQSLTDTASRNAVNGLLDQTVRRIEDAITRNIMPRLTRLEGVA